MVVKSAQEFDWQRLSFVLEVAGKAVFVCQLQSCFLILLFTVFKCFVFAFWCLVFSIALFLLLSFISLSWLFYFPEAQGKTMETFMAEHQDRSRNALQRSVEAAFLAWHEELKADQAQFCNERILNLWIVIRKLCADFLCWMLPKLFLSLHNFRVLLCCHTSGWRRSKWRLEQNWSSSWRSFIFLKRKTSFQTKTIFNKVLDGFDGVHCGYVVTAAMFLLNPTSRIVTAGPGAPWQNSSMILWQFSQGKAMTPTALFFHKAVRGWKSKPWNLEQALRTMEWFLSSTFHPLEFFLLPEQTLFWTLWQMR